MGSIAGAIIGLGDVFKQDNERRYAIDRFSHQALAEQYFEMAKTAKPEFAAELMQAGFAILSTPPGKKPPKEFLDLPSMMRKHIARDYTKGAVTIKARNPATPPGPQGTPSGYSEREILPVPGSSDGMQSGLGNAQTQTLPVTGAPNAGGLSILDGLNAAQSVPQNATAAPGSGPGSGPSVPPPGTGPMGRLPISQQPGSQAANPISGFPSYGFGPSSMTGSPRKAAPAMPIPMNQLSSPPMIEPPPVDPDLSAVNHDITLPASWERELQPNEYIDDKGERWANYKDLPRTPEQTKTSEMKALRDFAKNELHLTDPVDIADFIQNKGLQNDLWYVQDNVVINRRTGETRPVPKSPQDAVNKGFSPGTAFMDLSDPKNPKMLFQVPFKPDESPATGYRDLRAEWFASHPGQQPTPADITSWGNLSRAPQNQFDPSSKMLPNTQGRVASSVQPRAVPQGTQDNLSGTQQSIDEFKVIDNLLGDKKFTTGGPLWGRLTIAKFRAGGGVGLTPEQRTLANWLDNALTNQSFIRGGKQLTGTELAQFERNTPTEYDTLDNAITKTKTALSILRNHYNRIKGQLNQGMQDQTRDVDMTGGDLVKEVTGAPALESPPTGSNRKIASPATPPTFDPSKFDNRVKK